MPSKLQAIIESSYWSFMPGMRCRFEDYDAPVRILAVDVDNAWAIHENVNMPIAFECSTDSLHSPDFDDDATLGCLLKLVRKAWSAPGISTYLRQDGKWNVMAMGAKGLVATLTAQPKRTR